MPQPKFIIVSIDGGAAAGKSSTSRGLSERFDLMHVDTGSHYRAVTLKLLEAQVAPRSDQRLRQALDHLQLSTALQGRKASIAIDGWVPDNSIRSERVNQNVSDFAALPEVRAFLLEYQRAQADVARQHGFAGLIMEGRDIGSVVFPKADLRLFLYADPAKRAERRAKEGIIDSIEKRDQIDSSRQAAPLKRPEGSILIDSSELTLEEVIEQISSLIEEARKS